MTTSPPTIILVTGPESSGKSTLARQIAWALDGVLVPEVARDYLNARGNVYGPEDLPLIWQAQAEAEDLARQTNASFVVCDTGPEVIHVWAAVKYGLTVPEVSAAARQRPYDIILLCRPDIPWVADPLREAPEQQQREILFEEYLRLLAAREPVIITGHDRLRVALGAVEAYSVKTKLRKRKT